MLGRVKGSLEDSPAYAALDSACAPSRKANMVAIQILHRLLNEAAFGGSFRIVGGWCKLVSLATRRRRCPADPPRMLARGGHWTSQCCWSSPGLRHRKIVKREWSSSSARSYVVPTAFASDDGNTEPRINASSGWRVWGVPSCAVAWLICPYLRALLMPSRRGAFGGFLQLDVWRGRARSPSRAARVLRPGRAPVRAHARPRQTPMS